MKYTITRYEEKSDALFICITSDHCTMEHFFTKEEMLDRKSTIEHLLAHLEVMEDDYVEPEPFVSKLEDVAKLDPLDTARIATDKAAIVASKAALVAAAQASWNAIERAQVEAREEPREEPTEEPTGEV